MTNDEKTELMRKKEQQIMDILLGESMTFGMAKSIIQRVEVDLLNNGNTFLCKSELKNVFPSEVTDRHYSLKQE